MENDGKKAQKMGCEEIRRKSTLVLKGQAKKKEFEGTSRTGVGGKNTEKNQGGGGQG